MAKSIRNQWLERKKRMFDHLEAAFQESVNIHMICDGQAEEIIDAVGKTNYCLQEVRDVIEKIWNGL